MSDSTSQESDGSSRSWRKWVAGLLLLLFFAAIMREVLYPYRNQRFGEIPHGDHIHYIPKDRDPDVPVSRFPTQKPDDDERITPNGQVVPRRSGEGS